MRDVEGVLTLRSEAAGDVSALRRIVEKLRTPPEQLRVLSSSDPVVAATAFELHNYYCVCENLMRRVAAAFENALEPNAWHEQLLRRMSLDISDVRPALIDAALRAQLDELRTFRHFFRNAYDRPLHPGKVADMVVLLLAAHGPWLGAVQRFRMTWDLPLPVGRTTRGFVRRARRCA